MLELPNRAALALLVLFCALAGCTSVQRRCGECAVDVSDALATSTIPHGHELSQQLTTALTVLASCEPTESSIMEAAGFQNLLYSGQSPASSSRGCFSIVEWEVDNEDRINLILGRIAANGSVGPAEVLVVATRNGERWRFTWPVELGPPLH